MSTPRSLVQRSTVALLVTATTASLFSAACSDEPNLPDAPEVQVAAKEPPAISGGTMIMAADGFTAIAADPDRDRVWVVDTSAHALRAEIALQQDDEPGRLVLDDAGLVHVALRRGGAVAVVDPAAGKVVRRTPVCGAPRGLAFDSVGQMVHVACQSGELVSLDSATGNELRRLRLARDLRDVIVQGSSLLVTRFKSAELQVVHADGSTSQPIRPTDSSSSFGQPFTPTVAWRTVAMPGGGVAMLHQRSLVTGEQTPLTISPGGYYMNIGCENSVVHGTVSVFRPDGVTEGSFLSPVAAGSISTPEIGSGSFGGSTEKPNSMNAAVLPVDMALSADGTKVAVVSAGNDQVYVSDEALYEEQAECGQHAATPVLGQPIAVAFRADGKAVVQLRVMEGGAPAIQVLDGSELIALPGVAMTDTGHDMFHTNKQGKSPVACASCHPEGGDDAKVWNVSPIGSRRTQSLGGGILATAPLHWNGDMPGLDELMTEVFVNRMGGEAQGPRKVLRMKSWMDSIPAPVPAPVGDADAIARGAALFVDETVACASCHSGPMRTNNLNKDVGTGQAFQVPMLVGIASRAPFMHDGCAKTLKERFTNTACGGGDQHGKTSQLSDAQLDDLVAYLESL